MKIKFRHPSFSALWMPLLYQKRPQLLNSSELIFAHQIESSHIFENLTVNFFSSNDCSAIHEIAYSL
jgi:hypothetical protein